MSEPPELEIQDEERRRVYQILDDEVIVGSGSEVDLRVAGTDVEERHLRLKRTGIGYQVETVRPGTFVCVNGDDLLCKDLQHGDEIRFGSVLVRFRDQGRVHPVSREAAPTVRERSRQRRPVARSPGGMPPWLLVSSLIAICGAGLFLVVRTCSTGTFPRTPRRYLDLAQEQFARNRPERALETLELVLSEATGEVRAEAERLQAEIRRQLAEAADLPLLDAAAKALVPIGELVRRYLQDAPQRPAARQLMRVLDDWDARFEEVSRRSERGLQLREQVDELRARFSATAAMSEPEQVGDVLFVVEWQTRLIPRGYRQAVAALDAYLAVHPDAQAVRHARSELLESGEQWFLRRMRLVDQLIDGERLESAESELRQLERFSLIEDWREHFAAREARLR